MASFTRVDKTPVSDTVIDQITELIRAGELKPGERLPGEHSLAELLGVGRSSVREALKALEALGLIRRSQEGSFVSEAFSGPALSMMLFRDLIARELEIIHLYQARQLLETRLGELTAANITDEDLRQLEDLCVAMERNPVDQVAEHVRLDKEFHRKISELAGNPVLTRLWEITFEVLFDIRARIPFTPEDSRRGDMRHRLLMDALRARNPKLVGRTIAETLEQGKKRLMAVLPANGQPG